MTEQKEQLRSRFNPLIVGAAVIAVIAVGIALGVAFIADEPGVVSPQTLAQSYLEARDAHDGELAVALFAPDATVNDAGVHSVEDQAGYFRWFESTGHRWTIEECSETDPGPPADVHCTITHYNDWTEALGIAPISGSFDFVIEDGQIVHLRNNFNFDEFGPVWERMRSWTEANGYDRSAMFRATAARFDAESIALWKQATEEFVAEQSGQR